MSNANKAYKRAGAIAAAQTPATTVTPSTVTSFNAYRNSTVAASNTDWFGRKERQGKRNANQAAPQTPATTVTPSTATSFNGNSTVASSNTDWFGRRKHANALAAPATTVSASASNTSSASSTPQSKKAAYPTARAEKALQAAAQRGQRAINARARRSEEAKKQARLLANNVSGLNVREESINAMKREFMADEFEKKLLAAQQAKKAKQDQEAEGKRLAVAWESNWKNIERQINMEAEHAEKAKKAKQDQEDEEYLNAVAGGPEYEYTGSSASSEKTEQQPSSGGGILGFARRVLPGARMILGDTQLLPPVPHPFRNVTQYPSLLPTDQPSLRRNSSVTFTSCNALEGRHASLVSKHDANLTSHLAGGGVPNRLANACRQRGEAPHVQTQ